MTANDSRTARSRRVRPKTVVLILMGALTANVELCVAESPSGPLSVSAAAPTSTSVIPPARYSAPAEAKGPHEAIAVHGHWTIDVRNPDGRLARHLEFENGVCLGQGDILLSQLLSGGAVTGGWQVRLGTSAIPAPATTSAACVALSPGNFSSPEILLDQNNDADATSGRCAAVNASFPSAYCIPVLNPPVTSGSALVLAGSFAVPAGMGSVQVTAVGTAVGLCGPAVGGSAATTLGECLTGGTSQSAFTGVYLTGVGGVPSALSIVAGQSVSVTVQVSFK